MGNFRERICFGEKRVRPSERGQLDSLFLGGGGGLFLSLLLCGGLGESSRVEREGSAGRISNWLDFSGGEQMLEEGAADRSINLELFHDDGARETENLGHLLADFFEPLLVQEHFVVQLVLDLGLGPGLLLCLASLAFLSLRRL